jgi:DNA primase
MTGSGDEGTGDRDLLLAANEAAARIFRDQLLSPASPGPRDYLTGRGFGTLLDETPWIIGYAPARWTNLVEHLTQQGYARATLLEELVGFTARCAPSSPATVPKYLNTPTTPVYSKREAPFGIGEQQASMRAGAVPVLVEGPLDAVAVQVSQQEHGEFAGIALCGTALSAALVKHLAHLNNRRVVLAFDSDDAGALATERAECALAPEFQDVLAMGPDSGGDPAEILGRSGAGAVHARLLAAGPAIDRVLGARIQRWAGQLDNAEAKVGCLREAATLLARFRPADAARHAVELAAVLGLDAEAVTRELVEAASPSPSNPLALVTECPLRPDQTVSHPPANSWRTQRSSTVSA